MRISDWSSDVCSSDLTVRVSDKRALFVGIDAYTEAGGCVLRDLFTADDGGWLQDAALLDTLVAAKLQAEAERIGGERSEEHTSELQSLIRNSYAVFCLKKKRT